MVVRRRAILALWRIYLARIGKRHSRFAITMPGLVVLFGLWRGWDHPLVPMLGGLFFGILALSPAMMMLQEKLTGSLRFVGSLPISGQEHAASRVLTAATMATPAALAGAVALILYPVVPFAAVAPAALANWALLTVVSIFGTALHYRYPFGYVVQLVLWSLFCLYGRGLRHRGVGPQVPVSRRGPPEPGGVDRPGRDSRGRRRDRGLVGGKDHRPPRTRLYG